ncbi:MAG: fluoride efflux transporter CrcB [Spirochaetia bacterium]
MTALRLLSVAVGGALGAVTRYVVSHAVAVATRSLFPWGTLVVNAAGCFLIGVLMVGSTRLVRHPEAQVLLVTGFVGALTTFSTFSLETVILIEREVYWQAAANVVVSLVVGIVFVLAGGALARYVARIG